MDRQVRSGTILVVEDEPLVRQFISATLAETGYAIIEAGNASEAENVMRTDPGQVALVISDIRMPGGSGLDFANELEIMRPGTPVLYISGLVDSIAVKSIATRTPKAMLTKPFTAKQLLDRVREMLAENGDRGNASIA